MGRITSVKISYGETGNLGNFESVRVDVELAVDVEIGDNTEAMLDNVKNMAKIKVKQYIEEKKNGI